MHFTREPIIESILSARDGFKLVLKNSKTSSSTEISAEVIEIVSFSGSIFYRSQDRTKNFLVPASDFEVAEVKDARLVLKNISLEKSNKLTNPPKDRSVQDPESELSDEALEESDEETASQTSSSVPANNNRIERRRERRRNRRRRHSDDRVPGDKSDSASGEDSEVSQETAVQPKALPQLNLIPPPTTLISQTIARYKEKFPESVSADSRTAVVEESTDQTSFQAPLEPEDLV